MPKPLKIRRPLRAAILGLGQIAHEYSQDPKRRGIVTHTQAYLADPRFTLVGAYDPLPAKRTRYRLKWDIPVHESIESLMQSAQPSVVSLCSPYPYHLDNLKRVLQHDCVRVVFCEKPLAMDDREALAVKKLLKTRPDVSIVVNFSRRFDKTHQDIAKRIRNGGLGQLQCMDAFYGGSFLSNGSHLIDLIEWYAGPIIKVQKIKNTQSRQPHALLTLQSKIPVMIHHLDPAYYLQFELHIYGTKQKVSLINNGFTVDTFAAAPSAYFSGIKALRRKSTHRAYEGVFENALDEVYKSASNPGKARHYLLDEAIRNLKIISQFNLK